MKTNIRSLIMSLSASGLLLGLTQPVIAAGEDECLAGAEPLLSVADFNGDGIVEGLDIRAIQQVLRSRQYIAFYDRNADGVVDSTDVDLSNADRGKASTGLDQHIAAVFAGTSQYLDLGRAALDGFEPATQVVEGHGRHWMDIDQMAQSAYPAEPQVAAPAGLNYDEEGHIQAVFWGQPTAYPLGTLPAPVIFSEPQDWHGHELACITHYGLIKDVLYQEGIDPGACAADGGISGTFYMLHLWLYRLNPNGAFAMTHPCA